MSSSSLSKWCLVSALAVSGCDSDTAHYPPADVSDIFNKEFIKGKYSESKQNATLQFTHDTATLSSKFGSMDKPFLVRGNKIVVTMRNRDIVGVVRPDLEIIITNNGNELICTACASMGLDSHWFRVD
ncbi:hypothetical protein CR151_16570 [Vibrio cholerae]|uniref:hypothetical protein n=1 Tax=Vibrio cholerae TaxID=666 RepID=UPI000C7E91D4|nr:hypothetical protein [Vibrio cholerae]PKQ52213.1 hypothetical protein CR151_16570 [Vibrio cholerae]